MAHVLGGDMSMSSRQQLLSEIALAWHAHAAASEGERAARREHAERLVELFNSWGARWLGCMRRVRAPSADPFRPLAPPSDDGAWLADVRDRIDALMRPERALALLPLLLPSELRSLDRAFEQLPPELWPRLTVRAECAQLAAAYEARARAQLAAHRARLAELRPAVNDWPARTHAVNRRIELALDQYMYDLPSDVPLALRRLDGTELRALAGLVVEPRLLLAAMADMDRTALPRSAQLDRAVADYERLLLHPLEQSARSIIPVLSLHAYHRAHAPA